MPRGRRWPRYQSDRGSACLVPTFGHWTKSLRDSLELTDLVCFLGRMALWRQMTRIPSKPHREKLS
jgi:hypothetical protein